MITAVEINNNEDIVGEGDCGDSVAVSVAYIKYTMGLGSPAFGGLAR